MDITISTLMFPIIFHKWDTVKIIIKWFTTAEIWNQLEKVEGKFIDTGTENRHKSPIARSCCHKNFIRGFSSQSKGKAGCYKSETVWRRHQMLSYPRWRAFQGKIRKSFPKKKPIEPKISLFSFFVPWHFIFVRVLQLEMWQKHETFNLFLQVWEI